MLTIGTVLKCSTAGTTTYGTTVGKIRNLNRSGIEATDVEIHTLDDAPNMTFEPGWLNAGEFAITVLYSASTTADFHTKLNSLFTGRVTAKWQLIHATTTIVEEFTGYVKSIGRDFPLDGFVAQDFTIKLTGAVGLTT